MRIFDIGNIPEDAYAEIGGKARGLDFLKRNGFSVPSGFVIADIFDIADTDFDAVFGKFDALGVEKVSVRSSAADEDGAEYSGAGQYSTCLDVTRGELVSAVTECVESLFAERVAAYSANLVKKERSGRMNIVVQTMIDSAHAGVVFTSDPSDNTRVLIESVEGKGENLVSGAFSSESFSIPKSGFSVESGGSAGEKILREVYSGALSAAEKFGGEVDMEWAADKNGKLYWLQLRPITTLCEASADEFDSPNPLDNHLLTARNIGEMLAGAVTPLSISTSVLAIDYGIRNMLYKIGAIKSISDKPDYYTALSYKQHLFMDMTALHGMSKRVAAASPPAMNLSIMGEFKEDYPKIDGRNAFFLTKIINAAKFGKYIFSSEKAKKNLVELEKNLEITDGDTAAELYAEITGKLPAINEALCNHYICSSFSGAMNSGLYMTLSKNFETPQDYQAFISTVLSDIEGIESADILSSMRDIAAAVKESAPNADSMSENELLAFVTDPENEKAHGLYKEFLVRHGHRGVKEAEMRSKAWKNDPVSLMRNLKTVLISCGADAEEREKFDLNKFLKEYKGKGKGALKFLAPRARKAVTDREFSKSYIIKIIDKFKDKYILLADKLVSEAFLPDSDCIYFLTHEEIGRLLNGETRLRRKALSRRALFGEFEDMTFPDVCVGKPEPLEGASEVNGGELKGIPVSKGRGYGRARVIKNLSDVENLQKGEIMVAPVTDIGYSPYYSLIGALVTEVGSALSHGAVVAREYCLPTVVNVKGATKIVKTGDYLMVNASAGTVKILTEEEYKNAVLQ